VWGIGFAVQVQGVRRRVQVAESGRRMCGFGRRVLGVGFRTEGSGHGA